MLSLFDKTKRLNEQVRLSNVDYLVHEKKFPLKNLSRRNKKKGGSNIDGGGINKIHLSTPVGR